MGDGRYYSYDQFILVAFFMIIAMVIMTSLTSFYIRKKEQRLTTIVLLALGIVILRIVEYVIPSLEAAAYLRHFSSCLMILWFLLNNDFFLPRRERLPSLKMEKVSFLLLLCGAIGSFFYQTPFLISTYGFPFNMYGSIYKWALVMILGYCMMVEINWAVHEKAFAFRKMVVSYVPFAVYVLAIFNNIPRTDYIEGLLFIDMLFISNIRSFVIEDESYDWLQSFDDMADLINDYILVTDLYGKVIYQNQKIVKSSVFKKVDVVSEEDLLAVFKSEKKGRKVYQGKAYIQIQNGERQYFFDIVKRPLLKQNQPLGKMYTFIDITEMMCLLFKLDGQREKSLALNNQLKNDSEVVYQLEKEKEIKSLLDEILHSREEEMSDLMKAIDQLKQNMHTPSFAQDIDSIIMNNAQILERVRAVVASYRTYYGGNDD